MFGYGKKKKNEAEEVKKAIEPVRPPVQTKQDIPELKKIEAAPVAGPKSFAPLYIKIEKYKEVLQKIQKMRSLINNINKLVELQESIDKSKMDAFGTLKKNIQEFQNAATELDKELVRPQQFEPYIKDTQTPKLDTYTKELEGEVNKLKDQLGKF